MKSVVLAHADANAARAAQAVLNGLSGVVAVDVRGAQTISHCGDRLDAQTLVGHAAARGVAASMLSEAAEEIAW